VHGAALSSGPSCRQDGDRYFERLQPAAKKLHVFVAVAATTAVVVVLKEHLMLLSVPMNCGHFHLTYFIQTFIT